MILKKKDKLLDYFEVGVNNDVYEVILFNFFLKKNRRKIWFYGRREN